jgi:hypothetical protein
MTQTVPHLEGGSVPKKKSVIPCWRHRDEFSAAFAAQSPDSMPVVLRGDDPLVILSTLGKMVLRLM